MVMSAIDPLSSAESSIGADEPIGPIPTTPKATSSELDDAKKAGMTC